MKWDGPGMHYAEQAAVEDVPDTVGDRSRAGRISPSGVSQVDGATGRSARQPVLNRAA